MTIFDDPNREAVGLAPIWTEPAAEPEFDPGEHTVDEVKAYVGEHPDDTQAIYDAEAAGKARSSLLDWLTGE